VSKFQNPSPSAKEEEFPQNPLSLRERGFMGIPPLSLRERVRVRVG